MARLFDDGSTEYLSLASGRGTGYPITMCAWFNTNDDSIFETVISLAFSSGQNPLRRLAIDGTASNEVWASERDNAGTIGNAITSTGFTANTWHHAAAVFTSNSSRTAYIDGGSAGSNATALGAQTLDKTGIGVLIFTVPAFPFSGRIAEVAVWTAALTAGEVASLAAGMCPLSVQPASLADYWPLGGVYDANDGDNDIVGGYHMTPVATPGVGDHPPGLIYPCGGVQAPWVAAAAAAGNPWHYYKQLSGAAS